MSKYGIQMQDLSTGWLHCDPGPMFTPEFFTLPGWIPTWVRTVVLLESDYLFIFISFR